MPPCEQDLFFFFVCVDLKYGWFMHGPPVFVICFNLFLFGFMIKEIDNHAHTFTIPGDTYNQLFCCNIADVLYEKKQ